jgi:hypothetical protein
MVVARSISRLQVRLRARLRKGARLVMVDGMK